MKRKNLKVRRQPTEEDIKKSDSRYKDLADSLPQAVAETDGAGNITFSNLMSLKLFGYTKEDFDKGLNIFQMIAPEDHQRAKENFEKLIKGQEKDSEEYIGAKRDGSRFPFKVYLGRILDKNETVGIRAIVIDITESKRLEEALYISELQSSQAMDLANIVYWELDPANNMLIFNDPFYALYGTTAEREGGYRMTREEYTKRFVHPDDQPHIGQVVVRNITGPGSESLADIEIWRRL